MFYMFLFVNLAVDVTIGNFRATSTIIFILFHEFAHAGHGQAGEWCWLVERRHLRIQSMLILCHGLCKQLGQVGCLVVGGER